MSIHLAGGGTPAQEAPAWRAAFEGVERVVYWPFALAPERAAGAEHWLHLSMARLRLAAQVDTWPTLAGRDPGELDGADLLFVGGGATSRLALEVVEHGFAPAVAERVRAGMRYYGESAGAILAGPDVTVAALFEDDPAAVGVPGLGLVDLAVFPHADTRDDGRPGQVAREVASPVLALDEDGCASVDGDRVLALGPGRVRLFAPDGAPRPLA